MKQIIPFKKELSFKTKCSEITSISLEHEIEKKEKDIISGKFHITGDYKMTEGSINREKFDFELPFDITLDSRYDTENMVIDIDDFNYEVINNEILKVSIDLYIEGDEYQNMSREIEKEEVKPLENLVQDDNLEELTIDNKQEEKENNEKQESVEITKDINYQEINKEQLILEPEKREVDIDISNISQNVNINDNMNNNENKELIPNINLFDNLDNMETYLPYRVYIVKEEDTLEKIITKYNVTYDDLACYNAIEDIKVGDKIVIPTSKNE